MKNKFLDLLARTIVGATLLISLSSVVCLFIAFLSYIPTQVVIGLSVFLFLSSMLPWAFRRLDKPLDKKGLK